MANLVELIISAINKASPTVKQITKDISDLDKSAQKTDAALSKMGKEFAGALGLTLGVAGVVQLTRAIGEMAVQSGKAQQLRASFDDLASGVGQSSQAMLAAMREASAGLVSDADLILSANKAMLLGVADTADEMTALLEVARARGAAMGLSTTQAFNDIVTGLGRESALILDNLGITIDLEGVMQKYAASLGTTADALDATQRKQALLNEVMRQSAGMGAPIETIATTAERARVAQENAAVAVGGFFAPAVREAFQAQIDLIAMATGEYDGLAVKVREVQDAMADRGAELSKDRIAAMSEYAQAIADVQAAQAAGIPKANEYAAALSEMFALARAGWLSKDQVIAINDIRAAIEKAIAAQDEWNNGLSDADGLIKTLNATERESAAAAAAMQSTLEGMAAKLGAVGAVALATSNDIESFNRAVAGIQSAKSIGDAAISRAISLAAQAAREGASPEQALSLLQQTETALADTVLANDNSTAAQLRNQMAVDGVVGSLEDYVDGLRDANRASEKLASQGIKDATKAYDDLKSKIAGVVSGLTSIGDIAIESGGPRTDAANENARRLAAIANEGLAGQSWLEEFKAEAPRIFDEIVLSANPRAAAARLYEEFQAGMHPELLDREMIKANIRRMILGEQTMDAYIAEIAAELKAEGVWSPAAEAVVAGMTGSMSAANVGQQVGATTLASINTPAAVLEFQNAGESAFGSWKTGWELAAGTWHPAPPTVGGTTLETIPPASGTLPQVEILPFQGTTDRTSRSSGGGAVTVTVNVSANGNANPTAVSMAARSGVLDGLRAAGVR